MQQTIGKMKKTAFISILLLAFLAFTSCQKNFEQKQSPGEQAKADLDQIGFSSGFNWETSQNLQLYLTSAEEQLINIKSPDGKTRYFHEKHQGAGKEMLVKINIPKSVKTILVNNKEIDVGNGKISETLNQ